MPAVEHKGNPWYGATLLARQIRTGRSASQRRPASAVYAAQAFDAREWERNQGTVRNAVRPGFQVV